MRPPRDPTDPRGRRAVARPDDADDLDEAWWRRAALPAVPTLAVALVVVVLAFVLGRATGGGDDSSASPVRTGPTTSTTTVIRHTVKAGEGLLGIASQYGVSPEELAAINGITNQNRVLVGQVLIIPPSTAPTTASLPSATTTTLVP